MLDSNDEYAYTSELNHKQWAWEFMRRNPQYQKDYQWFIQLWQGLEKDYGRSPDVDYQAWKQDPRSYKLIDISSAEDGNCAISNDKLLIECWMGSKWGFFQFPVSPEKNALDVDITWRPLAPDYCAPDNSTDVKHSKLNYAVTFDLSKSLKEQLESVKHDVLIAQRRLRKEGHLIQYTLQGKRKLWNDCLKFIDSKGIETPNIQKNTEFDVDLLRSESDYFLCHYLNILTLLKK